MKLTDEEIKSLVAQVSGASDFNWVEFQYLRELCDLVFEAGRKAALREMTTPRGHNSSEEAD